jgi:hypothetical protein
MEEKRVVYRPGIGTKQPVVKCHVYNDKVVHVGEHGSYCTYNGEDEKVAYQIDEHGRRIEGSYEVGSGQPVDGGVMGSPLRTIEEKAERHAYDRALRTAGIDTLGRAAPIPGEKMSTNPIAECESSFGDNLVSAMNCGHENIQELEQLCHRFDDKGGFIQPPENGADACYDLNEQAQILYNISQRVNNLIAALRNNLSCTKETL